MIESMTMNLTKPIPLNFETMHLNRLSILIGINGVGKSFFMVNAWATSFILSAVVAANLAKAPIDVLELSNYVYKNVIDGEMEGNVWGHFKEATVKLAFSGGNVIGATVTGYENIKEPSTPVYMSSRMRLFSSMDFYLKDRKDLIASDGLPPIEKLVERYKLYDVMCVERLIAKMPMSVDAQLKEKFECFGIKDDITCFTVDVDKCEFQVQLSTGATRCISRWYGSGHQSIFNMILSSLI